MQTNYEQRKEERAGLRFWLPGVWVAMNGDQAHQHTVVFRMIIIVVVAGMYEVYDRRESLFSRNISVISVV